MLTNEEHTQLLGLLAKLEPGFYPIELFWQFARLMTVATLEFIPLRLNGGRVEVLLTRRRADDPFWPGKLHIPGCVVRPTDAETDVLDRIRTDELGKTETGEPVELATNIRSTKRGNEMTKLFWVEVKGDSPDGEFYDVSNLPVDLLEVYPAYIKTATEAFQAHRNN